VSARHQSKRGAGLGPERFQALIKASQSVNLHHQEDGVFQTCETGRGIVFGVWEKSKENAHKNARPLLTGWGVGPFGKARSTSKKQWAVKVKEKKKAPKNYLDDQGGGGVCWGGVGWGGGGGGGLDLSAGGGPGAAVEGGKPYTAGAAVERSADSGSTECCNT